MIEILVLEVETSMDERVNEPLLLCLGRQANFSISH